MALAGLCIIWLTHFFCVFYSVAKPLLQLVWVFGREGWGSYSALPSVSGGGLCQSAHTTLGAFVRRGTEKHISLNGLYCLPYSIAMLDFLCMLLYVGGYSNKTAGMPSVIASYNYWIYSFLHPENLLFYSPIFRLIPPLKLAVLCYFF